MQAVFHGQQVDRATPHPILGRLYLFAFGNFLIAGRVYVRVCGTDL